MPPAAVGGEDSHPQSLSCRGIQGQVIKPLSCRGIQGLQYLPPAKTLATKVTLSNSQPTHTKNVEELCQLANDVPHQEDVPYSAVDKGAVSGDNVEENVDPGPTSSLVQHSPSSLQDNSIETVKVVKKNIIEKEEL